MAAGSSYGTDFETMTKAAQSVNQAVQDIGAEMRSLDSALEPIASAWKGQAASAFQQLIQKFNDDCTKLTQALDAIGQAMGANTKNYTAAEEQQSSAMGQLLQGL